ncbi:Xylose operon regulatory protein [Aquisphaera giovannonii]|uniref:Xylose operon regulatory protein n=1 Tax=Aquisphaera giovannonii TaxID=406548 RepID=A0A5B9W567_9BACT|nr:DNA-binding transcriptional regulator [Aquisphaera giovannonii]QEH35171.1 Xylose operon regulatory protein [Aquisphaera giovannonii]
MGTVTARIGLVFGYGLGYYRDILRGIRLFAASRPGWLLTPIAPEPVAVQSLRLLEPDGFIAQIFDPELARSLQGLGRPLVNVSGVLPELRVPRVGVDHEAVGRMAAEHLLDRGLRRFGFLGYRDHAFSLGRQEGFRRVVRGAGCEVDVYHQAETIRWETSGLWRWDEGLEAWIRRLAGPVGVLASHDLQGLQLCEACRRAGVRVPEEAAIVGVDDDDLLCELARPPLSSVGLPAERIGFEAARLLDRLLSAPARRAVPRPILLPPGGVVSRGSSDMLAIDDPVLAEALRFIREQAHRPLPVGEVARAASVSRRSLERRFRSGLGQSVLQQIRRARVERARALLARTGMPIGEVALASGFGEPKQLSTVFRQETGMTPTAYRGTVRARG